MNIVCATNINSSNKLKINDSTGFEDKIIRVLKISSGVAVFEVDGEKQAIKLNEEKPVDGVKIIVNNIFYVEEKEDRFVEFDVFELFSYECGNGKCETGEEQKCCKDCGCSIGYKCVDNYCELIKTGECSENNDCDDDNSTTLDLCTGTPKKCIHTIVIECNTNEDCNDDNNCTKDECIDNTCYNKKINNCELNKEEKNIQENKNVTNEETLNKQTNEKKQEGFFDRIFIFIKQKLFKLVNF
jgi:hypothetical protein